MKERLQNPVVGDDLTLRLFTYNSNNRSDVAGIEKVEIYSKEGDEPELLKTISSEDIYQEEVGQYSVSFNLSSDIFKIGNYADVWTLILGYDKNDNEIVSTVENGFRLYPMLWYTDTTPIVYDFSFDVRPNKIRKGSKRFLMIGIYPNVPKASDLSRYYENIAITSPLKIYMEMECVSCMPQEPELRMVIEGENVQYREHCRGFYQLDTTDIECGVYNVWFEMEFGESIYISDKQQIQIY